MPFSFNVNCPFLKQVIGIITTATITVTIAISPLWHVRESIRAYSKHISTIVIVIAIVSTITTTTVALTDTLIIVVSSPSIESSRLLE